MVELVLTGSDATGWRTRAIWERNEPALLPTADEVLVGDAPCPWAEIAPGLTAVPGLDPIRWSAPHWPTAKRSPP